MFPIQQTLHNLHTTFQIADLSVLDKDKYYDLTIEGTLVAVSKPFEGFIKVCFIFIFYFHKQLLHIM